jgi:thioredoxin 1
MAGANTLSVTDTNFDTEVVNSQVPVLVDFWAEWCGPCKMMAPTVEQIASDYAGRLKVVKIDVDENGGTAMRFNIRGIPTLLLFKGGRVVDSRVGAVSKSDVIRMLDKHV